MKPVERWPYSSRSSWRSSITSFEKDGLEDDAELYLRYVHEVSGYRLDSLTWDDILQLPAFPEVPEMHDRLIAIAAKRLDATALTRDASLHGCPQIRCLW